MVYTQSMPLQQADPAIPVGWSYDPLSERRAVRRAMGPFV